MHDVDLSAIDLNLLVALDALLAERNVTRAAKRVGRTQPAMSHALARLRDLLGDPLLVRQGRGMTPTPRGLALADPLAAALTELRRVLRDEGGFDPATSARTFTLVCPDLLVGALPALLGAMTAEAPGVGLAVRSPAGDTPAALASADLALGAATIEGPSLRRRGLGEVGWTVLARQGHPGVRRRLSLRQWLAYPHIQVGVPRAGPSFVDRALMSAGLERRVALHVPTFLLAPEVVARTDCFFTTPKELAAPLAERLGLRMLRPPIALPPIPVAAFWPERLHADEGQRWFRGLVIEEVKRAL